MAADALSEVLRTVRLTGATFFDIVGKAPWVAEQPPREMVLPKILPGAEHLIAYHVVTEGRCFGAHRRRRADRRSKRARSSSSPMATRMSCRAVPGMRAETVDLGVLRGRHGQPAAVLPDL